MPYTLGQAANATGKQKSTILGAIKSGRLSATRNELNEWQIDPAELHRVYEPKPSTERHETPPNTAEIALREEKIRFLEREISRLEQTTSDLREDRDHWRRQATYLIEHQPLTTEPEPEPKAEEIPPPKKRSWFSWK